MKKVITIFTLIVMCFGITAAADNMFSEKELIKLENNIRFLDEIGVMEYSDNITQTVTRAEYAKILTAMNKVDAYKGATAGFTDVDKNTEYADYINNAYALGFMNGYGDGNFGPTDTLTYDQAIYGLVRVLGYGSLIENNISTYSAEAYKLGIYDDAYGFNQYPITYGSLSVMIINTLEAEVLNYNPSTGVAEKSGETLIQKVFGMEERRGVLTANEITALNQPEGVGNSQVMIDDYIYRTQLDTTEFLGYCIDYYVNSEDEVIFISKNISRNSELEIKAEQIEDYRNRTYTYSISSGRSKTEEIPKGCSVIYNGRAISGEAEIDMHIKNGSVVFIDNNRNGDYDVVKITDIKAMVVGAVNTEDYLIYDKFNPDNILMLGDAYYNGTLNITNYQGLECSIADISAGNVISIIRSADGYNTELKVSKTKATGAITSYSETDELIGVAGEKYQFREGEFTGSASAGENGTLYVDIYGYAIYFEKNSDGFSYGYVIKELYEITLDSYGLKVFDFETGKFKVMYFNEKRVVADGTTYTNDKKLLTYLRNGSSAITPQVIGYKTNTADRIMKLDTLMIASGEDEEDTLRSHTTASDVEWRSSQQCFRDGKTFTTASTAFIKMPSDVTNASQDDFIVYSPGELSTDAKYTFTSYQTKKNILSADIILISEIDYPNCGIVRDIKQTLNQDDETIYEIMLYMEDGSEVSAIIEDEENVTNVPVYAEGTGSYKLTKGDVISYSFKNVSGTKYILDTEMIFDYETGYLPGNNPYQSWSSNSLNFYCGNVYNREGSIIGMTTDSLDSEVKEYTSDELTILSLGTSKVYKKGEGEKLEIIRGSANDILDYETVSGEYSKVFVMTRAMAPRMVYIYN